MYVNSLFMVKRYIKYLENIFVLKVMKHIHDAKIIKHSFNYLNCLRQRYWPKQQYANLVCLGSV